MALSTNTNDGRPTFTRAELTLLLNNTCAALKRPAGFEPSGIPEARLTDLRRLAEAFLETIEELESEGHLRWEESVYALTSLALMIQLSRVNGKETLPRGVVSQDTLDSIKKLIGVK